MCPYSYNTWVHSLFLYLPPNWMGCLVFTSSWSYSLLTIMCGFFAIMSSAPCTMHGQKYAHNGFQMSKYMDASFLFSLSQSFETHVKYYNDNPTWWSNQITYITCLPGKLLEFDTVKFDSFKCAVPRITSYVLVVSVSAKYNVSHVVTNQLIFVGFNLSNWC